MTTETAEPAARAGGRKGAAKARAGVRRTDAIARLMRTEVHRVGLDASANDAARLMWEKDVGAIPVVDEDDRLRGIVTDRDIAMAAYLRGETLWNIPIGTVMTTNVVSAQPEDSVEAVRELMSRRQVRRIPIVDDQGTLVGIVTLNDLALAATAGRANGGITEHDVADTLRAVCVPRVETAELRAI